MNVFIIDLFPYRRTGDPMRVTEPIDILVYYQIISRTVGYRNHNNWCFILLELLVLYYHHYYSYHLNVIRDL